MREDGDVLWLQARRVHCPHRALGLVLRRGRNLGRDELPVDERDEIGERPADVDSQPCVCHRAIISVHNRARPREPSRPGADAKV